jgi:sec-independent protein translocase protein TatA
MGILQPGHLIVILAIVLLIFGPGKLADLGKALGLGIRELKKGADVGDGSPSAAATRTPTPGARPCPSCNTAVPATDKYCGGCGRVIA